MDLNENNREKFRDLVTALEADDSPATHASWSGVAHACSERLGRRQRGGVLVAPSGCFVEPQLATQAAGREPGQSWH